MKLKSSRTVAAVLIGILFIGSANVYAKPNSKGADSAIVVGTLTSVDSSGKAFDVQQTGESLRRLQLDSKSKVSFIGFSGKSKHEPQVGFGVKASCGKDGQIKTITFTPPIGKPSSLGEQRLTMTEQELVQTRWTKMAASRSATGEFSTYRFITHQSMALTHFARRTKMEMACLTQLNSTQHSAAYHGGNSQRMDTQTNGSFKQMKTKTTRFPSKSLPASVQAVIILKTFSNGPTETSLADSRGVKPKHIFAVSRMKKRKKRKVEKNENETNGQRRSRLIDHVHNE
jgi:hypothetical protein